MKQKKLPSSLKMITLLLILVVGAVWVVSMYCLTAVTAEYDAGRDQLDYEAFASNVFSWDLKNWFEETGGSVDQAAGSLWEAADRGGEPRGSLSEEIPINRFLPRPNRKHTAAATGIYDAEGNLLVCSWDDYFYFQYLTEEQWENRRNIVVRYARAFFDREKLTEAGRNIVRDGYIHMEARAMRFVGTFDGMDFTPTKIEYVDSDQFLEAVIASGKNNYLVQEIIGDYDLPWMMLYEDPTAVSSDADLVTFYAPWFDVCCHEPSKPCVYAGKRYDTLGELVSALGPELSRGEEKVTHYEWFNLLVPSVSYAYRVGDGIEYSPDFCLRDPHTGEEKELLFYTVSAVFCSPWRTAFGQLRFVYLLTLVLAAGLVVLVRMILKRYLVGPVQCVGEALLQEKESVRWSDGTSLAWRESQGLSEGFQQYGDTLRRQKNEITRLQTALDYAQTAEENRRQITSNLAHELKTPLAIIHSYAEGLKAHIAEEKREKYLDVILSEAERTDGMVLEMLDLSRLEAGRVKLSRDDFSLIQLTRSVFEKLQRMAEAKNLQIEFRFPKEFTITADEARMGQVVENLASNAVKYTPVGGKILVKIETGWAGTSFRIENDSVPLSEEALKKVWDTFYRTDEARSGGGTGLGLAIAKKIVELHGGTCIAQNVENGVQFGFVLHS